MIVFPDAKINIGLRITERRGDGYHNIETIFYPVKLHDALEFVPAGTNEDSLTETGLVTGAAGSDNLVIKAAIKLREIKSFPFLKIHLHKGIPSGAGLGGGSSDAACLLKAVNRNFSLGISDIVLKDLSLQLGSDCPFFIDNTPSHATGRGEILRHAGSFLEGYYLVLLNPGVHISTREAYSSCKPGKHTDYLLELVKRPVHEWRNSIRNDFEEFAIGKYPVIGELKTTLYGCGALFSLMSGSGSSVFGIFGTMPRVPVELSKYVIYKGMA